jgi:hypothetical protein
MYEVNEKQEAFRRSWEALSVAVDKDQVESALVLRRDKKGGFSYHFVGDGVSAYAWIGFLEFVKAEFLSTLYETLDDP